MGSLKLSKSDFHELSTVGSLVIKDADGNEITIFKSDFTEWELTKLGHGGTVRYDEDLQLDGRS